MPLLKSKKAQTKTLQQQTGQPIPTQIQNQSIVFRPFCYKSDMLFNDDKNN
jgi:hypothetical protein